jgi:hypothetical protein
MLSPIRPEPETSFPLRFISRSKSWNFENRTEFGESRASERNWHFGEYRADSAD